MLRHFGQEFNVAEIPVVVADVIDLSSLVSMCSRTRVLINCVGPVRFSSCLGALYMCAAYPVSVDSIATGAATVRPVRRACRERMCADRLRLCRHHWRAAGAQQRPQTAAAGSVL